MKKFKFKDGQVIVAATKEEAIKKHKVTASEYTDLEKEKAILTNNGFKIKEREYGEGVYAEQRMPGHKSIYAHIYKTKRGTFLAYCYVDDVADSVTDCVYESGLREVEIKRKTIQEAIKATRVYFKLVNKMIALHQKFEAEKKAIDKEAWNLR